jgi:ABC-type Fe3+/spermidine/putrescine transport system ATPase subunit
VIKDFSLNIKAGEVVCLLGTNGSGKTTIVNMLTGLEKLDKDKGNAYITIKGEQVSLRENVEEFR